MDKHDVVIHVNNNPGTNYISACGKYIIDENRKEIIYQNGYPVIAVSFKDIPKDVKWEVM